MNDIQIGDVFAHRTLTIKTPFTPVPFPATYEVEGMKDPIDGGDVHLRALHHFRLGKSKQLRTVAHIEQLNATLITELPDEHGERIVVTRLALEKHFAFLRHADGGI